jgi:hypothetical protein
VNGKKKHFLWQEKKLVPFDRNNNDKSTATKPDVLHVANMKPDTVKDGGFSGVINIPKIVQIMINTMS